MIPGSFWENILSHRAPENDPGSLLVRFLFLKKLVIDPREHLELILSLRIPAKDLRELTISDLYIFEACFSLREQT